jgi:hypothetical protein
MARVASLLIKGLSHKEIATVRAVSDRTVWEQARSISSKAGLTGRTALSAFSLEDLLAPSKAWNSRGAVRMQRTVRCAEARTRRTGLWDWVLACVLGLLHPGLAAHAGDAPCASPTRVRPYGGCARGSGDPTLETGTESVIPPDRSRGSRGRLRERRAFPPLRHAARSGALQPVARGEGHVQPGLALACVLDDETRLNPLLTNEAIDRSA